MEVPGKIAAGGAIVLSTFALGINFLCAPVLINKITEIRSQMESGINEFKIVSDKAWDDMMEVRNLLQVNSERDIRQANDAWNSNGNFPRPNPTQAGFQKTTWQGGNSRESQNDQWRQGQERGWTGEWTTLDATAWTPQASANIDESCPRGVPGPPGAPGKDGLPGIDGVDGEAGLDGNAVEGAIGEDGCIVCPQGPQGPIGPPGPRGSPGEKGWSGVDGNPGSDGWPGPQGPRGFRGQEGIAGKAGGKGKPGKPAPGGKGEPGPKGARGPIGRAGPQGPPGKPGFRAGPPGPVGQSGPKGEDGKPGTDGEMGPIGPEGVKGGDAKYCPCPKEILDNHAANPSTAGIGRTTVRGGPPSPRPTPWQAGTSFFGNPPGFGSPGQHNNQNRPNGRWWGGGHGKR